MRKRIDVTGLEIEKTRVIESKQNMVDIQAQTKEFERKLEEAEEDGTDPLSVWCAHIEWIEANKLTRHECYKKALQQCVQYFSWSNMSGYKGEVRLALVYLKMAKICTDPVAIYQHMLDNNIGTYCALFYDTFAAALSERGQVSEAVKLVKQGLEQNAQPIKKLQKRLESLKLRTETRGADTVTSAPSGPAHQAAPSTWQDEQSERNGEFYKKPGMKFCYQKELVYPREGGELSLEQIRASLPQYIPSFLNDQEGECDMDMTMAAGGHITMHIPVIPNFFKAGAKHLAQQKSRNVASLEDKENLREAKATRSFKPEEKGRKPLQSIEPLSVIQESEPEPQSEQQLEQGSSYDELEQLCADNDKEILQKSRERPNPLSELGRRQDGEDEDEDPESEFERQIEQLMIERDQAPPTAPLTGGQTVEPSRPAVLGEDMSVVHRDNLSFLKNQENQPREAVDPSGFEFTPSSTEGGIVWPAIGQKNVSGVINTRLNFSEADSTFGGDDQVGGAGTSRHHLSMSFGRATFNSTLDLERRAKVTEEQLKFESQFANTEVDTNKSWGRAGQAPPTSSQLQTSSIMEPSFSDSQSFEIFHDSWAHHSRNTSRADISRGSNVSGVHGRKAGSFLAGAARTKNMLGERRALQELPNPRSYAHANEVSVDHTSYAASQSNMSSFSVFEDESCADQSSIAPYHDSWSSAPSQAPPRGLSERNTGGHQQQPPLSQRGGREYYAPLEAPVMSQPEKREGESGRTMEQSFTQFDIRHPTNFEPVSTPMGLRSALVCDLSAIPDGGLTELEVYRPSKADPSHHPPPSTSSSSLGGHVAPESDKQSFVPLARMGAVYEGQKVHSKPNLDSGGGGDVILQQQWGNPHPPLAAQEKSKLQLQPGCPFNLSTITEESGSYKSSSSSSRLTVSSASSNSHSALSGGTPHSHLSQPPMEDINPFEQHVVNMMLNKLGAPIGKMEKINGAFPAVVTGQCLEVGGARYNNLRKLTDGQFAKKYVGKCQERHVSLKVQSAAMEWELAVVEELHSRLNSKGLHMWKESLLEVKKAYRFADASVLISPFSPLGSLKDLVDAYTAGRIPMHECLVLYYSCEVLSAVSALHQCGIVHTNIGPDSFVIKDIRSFTCDKQFSGLTIRGKGLCLVDFDHAVDTQVFPDDAMFIGSSEEHSLQCPAMLEGRPWKWQVDFFGVAAAVSMLTHGGCFQVKQDFTSGLFKPTGTLRSRKFDVSLWNKLFDILLNTQEALPLADLIAPLEEKLKQQKSILLRQCILKCCDTVSNYVKTKLN